MREKEVRALEPELLLNKNRVHTVLSLILSESSWHHINTRTYYAAEITGIKFFETSFVVFGLYFLHTRL